MWLIKCNFNVDFLQEKKDKLYKVETRDPQRSDPDSLGQYIEFLPIKSTITFRALKWSQSLVLHLVIGERMFAFVGLLTLITLEHADFRYRLSRCLT